jgi:hypothetical protein
MEIARNRRERNQRTKQEEETRKDASNRRMRYSDIVDTFGSQFVIPRDIRVIDLRSSKPTFQNNFIKLDKLD